MDSTYPYIASLTREPFLFFEMRTTAKLLDDGLSEEEVVDQICEDKRQSKSIFKTKKSMTLCKIN